MANTVNWPSDEDKLLEYIGESRSSTVLLDEETRAALLDYWTLQPINSLRVRGETPEPVEGDVGEDWISIDLAWVAAGVAVAAISSITAMLCTAMHKGYRVGIDFGERSGNAKLNLQPPK